MAKIFVSIANYRDFETLNTVREMISTCSSDNELRIVVLSQLEPEDRPLFTPLDETRQVVHLTCPAKESLGACWARATIQSQLKNEDYFLQIDSHMAGWIQDWDKVLISEIERAETVADRVVITAYPTGYEINTAGERVVGERLPTRFIQDMKPGFPGAQGRYADPKEGLYEEFFISANYLFARSHFARDVPYDPELFFMGEEITLAIRAYSFGYKIFSPSRYVMAHQYNRGGDTHRRSVFWDEDQDKARELKWWQRDTMSRWKATHICHGQWFGKYGVRNHALYEEFAQRLHDRFPDVDLRKVVPYPNLKIETVDNQTSRPDTDQTSRPASDQTSRPDTDLAKRPGDDQTSRPRIRVKALRG